MSTLAENFLQIQGQIAAATARRGGAAPVVLVAVSKAHPPEAITEAVEAGQTLFGENRVQEARAKIAVAPARARWHFIGRLQKNKIRQALPLFELLHSVDSAELAREIDRVAGEEGARPRVLLEVNLAGEASKLGFDPSRLREQLEALLALPRLHVEGLMTIPPPVSQPEDSRRYFAELRELRDALERDFHVKLPELSMGMSSDFTVAIEEGATLVRVGTALFGPRRGKTWRPGE